MTTTQITPARTALRTPGTARQARWAAGLGLAPTPSRSGGTCLAVAVLGWRRCGLQLARTAGLGPDGRPRVVCVCAVPAVRAVTGHPRGWLHTGSGRRLWSSEAEPGSARPADLDRLAEALAGLGLEPTSAGPGVFDPDAILIVVAEPGAWSRVRRAAG